MWGRGTGGPEIRVLSTPLERVMGPSRVRSTIRWIMIAVALLALWLALLRSNRPLAVLIGGTAVGALVERRRGGRWVVGAVTGGIIVYGLLLRWVA
jgi:hypothetical protein